MCRWLAYTGDPVLLDELLYKPKYSLIVQSLHSRLGAETTNGDGFGVGWYGAQPTPGVFHGVEPAWNDRNLRELAMHVASPLVLAHIRASSGSAVQQTNCHPFRHGRWLWMHNGLLRDFAAVKRDLALAVDPELYPHIEGSTDSELLFFLALTFGLEDDPPRAVERAVGLVEATGRRHGVEHPIQMTVATTDGERLWAFRYSSEGRSPRCSTAPTSARCGTSTRTTPCSTTSPTRHAWWCPSRSATSRAPGGRSRRRPAWSSAGAGTSCGRSRPTPVRRRADPASRPRP